MNSPVIPGVFRSMCRRQDMIITVAEAMVSDEMSSARFASAAETQAPLLLKQNIKTG